jgi:predicted dehydrogenase
MTTSLGRAKPVIVTLAKTQKGQDPNCTLQEITPSISPGSAWTNAMHYFIKCIVEKQKPFVSGEEGKATIDVILAAYKSAESGKWVDI